MNEKQQQLAGCLRQYLDDYVPEVQACIYLDKLSEQDVWQVKKCTERFLDALNKVLEEE